MSDTPRTDAAYIEAIAEAQAGDSLPVATAMIRCSRELERELAELAEAKAELERFVKAILK